MISSAGPAAGPDAGPGPTDAPRVRAALLAWFDARGRDLPWRQGPEGARDPYRVWVAEVLLQQTQVVRGRVYYERFLQAFPDVQALAAASEAEVLKAWEGCGYYARARNLHRAAREVAAQGFPQDYVGWRALPGVGPYTAAAVASLACGEARAVNDGNVRRVYARLCAEPHPTPRWVQARADEWLAPERPGAWNEALMDLGATVCTPRAPDCPACPLADFCAARALGTPTAFPAPRVRAAVREVELVAVLVGTPECAVLERRTGTLLGGLMGLPSEELQAGETPADALARLCQRLPALPGPALGTVHHTMTHRQLTLHLFAAQGQAAAAGEAPVPVPTASAALSRLDRKALEAAAQAEGALLR